MGKDTSWKAFFLDNERYADIINGIGCNGKQIVKKDDLKDADTQVGFVNHPKFIRKLSLKRKGNVKIRDAVRKVAFGMNFAIVGLENQEHLDYSIPIRNMFYDVATYDKQLSAIRKDIRKNSKNLSEGEYLYGFSKESKLYPVITFVIYSGEKEWDGPITLHQILDFQDIPKELQQMVADYKVNLINIRELEDTSVFKTDVRQVFDFIKCSKDKTALKNLVENDAYYQKMDEEAFDVVVQYTHATELVEAKQYYEKEGCVNMCQEIQTFGFPYTY